MLEREFQYFLKNRKQLVQKYKGEFIVVVGEEVVGAFKSEAEAYFDSITKYEPGKFLIQFCAEEESSYIQTFHSQVIFSNDSRR